MKCWKDIEGTIPAKDGDPIALITNQDGKVMLRQGNPCRRPVFVFSVADHGMTEEDVESLTAENSPRSPT